MTPSVFSQECDPPRLLLLRGGVRAGSKPAGTHTLHLEAGNIWHSNLHLVLSQVYDQLSDEAGALFEFSRHYLLKKSKHMGFSFYWVSIQRSGGSLLYFLHQNQHVASTLYTFYVHIRFTCF